MNDVTKDLLERITDISKMYERFGATCVFEGQPMMHLSHLEEIAELAARAEAALSSSDDTPPSAEERRLRRMLCLRCHGTAAYMDDGEASFGGDEFQRPTDYLRESLDSIQQAWVDAVMKEAASVLGDGKPFMRGCELRDDAVGVFKP